MSIQRRTFFHLTFISFIILLLTSFRATSVAFADGTNESPPCWPLSSCGSFTHGAIFDLDELKNIFVIIAGKFEHFCGDISYSISLDYHITIPSIDGYHDYFIIKKDYFNKAKGIEGLFTKEAPTPRCDKETMGPKDRKELDQHSFGLTDFLVLKDDLIFSRFADKVIGSRFIRVSSAISAWGKGPTTPSPITDKSHYYRPAGWYCDGVPCRLVMQRYKEVWTLDNGTIEEHILKTPAIEGLRPLALSPFQSGNAIVASPTPQPNSIQLSPPAQTTFLSTSSSAERNQLPQHPLQSPRRSFLEKIWCFVTSLFGGKCN